MTEKSKFDRKTPSAGFLNFIALWMMWSILIGIITVVTFVTLLQGNELSPTTLLLQFARVGLGTIGIYFVSRWQGGTVHKKTGREFRLWGIGSTIGWLLGVLLAHAVAHRLMIRSGYDTLASIGIFGFGLVLVYGLHGASQSLLIGKHIDLAWIYGLIWVAGVLFWILFVGDPRRIALGGLLAPALQGFVASVILMWLFHLSKLGNIAMKAKHDTVEDVA